PAGVELARRVDLGFTKNSFSYDSAYNVGLDSAFSNIPHTSSSLTVEWFASGAGWQGGSDESWAIDNLEVIVIRSTTAAVSVRVDDGRGGFDIQSFSIDISPSAGSIRGTAWDDRDGDGVQGAGEPGLAG